MTQSIRQLLHTVEKDLLTHRDVDGYVELHDQIASLLVQIGVQKSLDDIVDLLRQDKPLPIRRIGYNVKKLCSDDEAIVPRWQRITAMEPEAWVLCTVSFCKLASLPSSQFSWLVSNINRYLEAQKLPPRWIVSDQVRKLIVGLPRTEKTKKLLEDYHRFEMTSISQSGKRSQVDSSPELPSPKRVHIQIERSLPLTMPFTVKAAEVVVSHLQDGEGELDITFPQPQVHPPYLIVPYHLCSKIMKTYTD